MEYNLKIYRELFKVLNTILIITSNFINLISMFFYDLKVVLIGNIVCFVGINIILLMIVFLTD